jgi:hypothetical protein
VLLDPVLNHFRPVPHRAQVGVDLLNHLPGPVAELLEALCDVFGVSPGELLEREAGKAARKKRSQ